MKLFRVYGRLGEGPSSEDHFCSSMANTARGIASSPVRSIGFSNRKINELHEILSQHLISTAREVAPGTIGSQLALCLFQCVSGLVMVYPGLQNAYKHVLKQLTETHLLVVEAKPDSLKDPASACDNGKYTGYNMSMLKGNNCSDYTSSPCTRDADDHVYRIKEMPPAKEEVDICARVVSIKEVLYINCPTEVQSLLLGKWISAMHSELGFRRLTFI